MSLKAFFQDDFGERVLRVQQDGVEVIRAFAPVDLLVSFDPKRPAELRQRGLVPPIELVVCAPSASGSFSRVFYRVPRFVSFVPREGGPHHVLVRELHHNRWWGAIDVEVSGDRSAT